MCAGGDEITLRTADTMTDDWGLVVAGYFDDDLEDGDQIWYARLEATD